MKGNFILLLILLFVSSCKKDDIKGDLSEKESIRGRLYLVDTLTQQNAPTPLSKKKVTLSYTSSPDLVNFLFSTTTDDDGYFNFMNLKKGTSYRIQYQETVEKVVYAALKDVEAPQEVIVLEANIATKKQSGFHLTVVDPQGEKISNVNVCIFTNKSVFEKGTCETSDYQLKSDAKGRVYKFGITEGDYFVKASIKIGDVDYSATDTIKVIENNVEIKSLKLERVVPIPVGFQYTVTDTTGTKISGVNLCVFISRVVFGGRSCSGSTYQLITDHNGKASKFGLNPGKYFVYGTIKTYGKMKTDSTIFENIDSLIVEENKITNRELILKKWIK
ncbi:hypothetical protein AAE02nite_10260 [Adhaeribacter aerolatus]|uniref:Carboxypeptidase regulatory-like domain-containing protein n=1 Tax=Adhaeribacter aerolatus TaxID=670289 RepID=A0A512AUH1_9BACT|nr:hypothetical protein [Adhaeribacter aerolatus]GEO03362.1 hypothetical protein AAE02nite_10260 [Adhaeribacter aerolatus]